MLQKPHLLKVVPQESHLLKVVPQKKRTTLRRCEGGYAEKGLS
nr:hypothetical protein [Janibacter limosus]